MKIYFEKKSCSIFFICYLLTVCSQSQAEERNISALEFFQTRIKQNPDNYSAHSRIGEYWLIESKQTGSSGAIAKARHHLTKSLEIYRSFDALQLFAELEAYSHRFKHAIELCKEGLTVAPNDVRLLCTLAESLIALEQAEDMQECATALQKIDSFRAIATLATIYAAKGDSANAAKLFHRASISAKENGNLAARAWALAAEAGVWIDAKKLNDAKEPLNAAYELSPSHSFVLIHMAEFAELDGRIQDALEFYKASLKSSFNAEIHRRAFILAVKLELHRDASFHFTEAIRACDDAICVGEYMLVDVYRKLISDSETLSKFDSILSDTIETWSR